MSDCDHDRPGKEAARQRWEDYKQQVLARLAEAKFAPVYGGLQDAKPSGEGWMLARCPLHEDANPSLGYSTVTGQWSCFSGCGKGDAFGFLMRTTGRSFKDVIVPLGESFGLPAPSSNGDGAGLVAYDYRDETGALLFQVLRGPNKKFWQHRPDGSGGWINDLKGVRRVAYRLPDLLARPTETVFVVEGEKDVDTLQGVGVLATTNSGGAGKWRPSHSESLRGRDIVILPDNDAPGREHAAQVAGALTGIAASIKIVALPDLPEKGDVSDWFAAGHTIEELQEIVGVAQTQESDREEPRSWPVIVVNDQQQRRIFAETWRALLSVASDIRLFRYAGNLAQVLDADDGPQIALLDETASYGLLVRHADWVIHRGAKIIDSKPSRELARDLLSRPDLSLPMLEGIVTTPVLTAGGRLLTTPGYDPESHLWYAPPPGYRLPDVPQNPTGPEVDAAVQLLTEDLLVDFEFAAESDQAHALAALLLPFVRRLIDGPTPVHLLEAPTPGSGKSLLADLIWIVTLGRSCEATTVTRNEDESRKKLTAILSRGRPIVVIDNIQGALESAQLAAAITAEQWSDRILGRSQMVEFPNRALWLITGNNPKLSMEIARRCVRIRLEPRQERPWEREGFKHDPIRGWAREHRDQLVGALLVLVQSWLAAGRPPGTKKLGSFEIWATTIGGILRHAGVRDFLADTKEFYQAADFEAGEWRAFVAAWHEAHQSVPVTPTTLLDLAEAQRLVPFAYAGTSEQGRLAKFGKALSALRGRRFGPLQVVAVENRKRCSNDYRLVPVAGELFSDKEASE